MTRINHTDPHNLQLPPWNLQGEGFILNYWLTPQFLKKFRHFGLSYSSTGRLVQVILVRYQDTPIQPYDELLILDHPLMTQRILSTIPKIYVSTTESVIHGRRLWGIPKELARFEWRRQQNQLFCHIASSEHEMSLHIGFSPYFKGVPVNSKHLPKQLMQIDQFDGQQHYRFRPEFKGSLNVIYQAYWKNTGCLFPDFSQAIFLKGLYVPAFDLIFPKAQIT